MNIEAQGETLRVADFKDLGAAGGNVFRDKVRAAFGPSLTNIDIDLGETAFIDSCGLGVLISLQKTVVSRKGVLRLLNPQPAVMQILRLTRLNTIFQVVEAS